MPEYTLADVITRLDRLESALYQLIEVVRSGQGRGLPFAAPARPAPGIAVAPPPSAPRTEPVFTSYASGVAGAGEPPLIQVAAPVSGEPQMTMVSEFGADGVASVRAYDQYMAREDVVVPGAGASIQQVLQRVFEAGLMVEPEDTWAVMTKLTHPSQMEGPRAIDHYKAFNWHKLRRTAAGYLRNGDPATFIIAYTEPAEVTPEVDRVRVFVRAGDNRMPVPIGFLRDAANGNAWRVTLMSL